MTDLPPNSAAPAPIDWSLVSTRQTVVAVLASCFGWALDLFDLFILLYVAPIIGRLFFPSAIPMLSLAGAYASFAVTLLLRPLGSALFGSYADRFGRRRGMMVAVIGVGVTTALFGTLPSVGQIGLVATLLFLALRVVQGIFVGGVVASTHTIGTESVPPRWRGLVSGLVGGGGSGIGGILASLVYLAASALFPGPAFEVWGWRVMFFSGLLTTGLGVLLFNTLAESPFWEQLQRAGGGRRVAERTPVRRLFHRDYRGIFAVNMLLAIGAGAGYYLTAGYLPSFLRLVNRLPYFSTSMILLASNLAGTIGAVLIGHLSEFIGRRPTFLIMGVLRILLLPLLFLAMAATQQTGMILLLALGLAFLGNGSYGPLLIFLNERYPTSLRASGTGLTWNIAFAIGGIMPTFVSLFAAGPGSIPWVLSAFLLGASVLFLAGAIIAPETRGHMLGRQE